MDWKVFLEKYIVYDAWSSQFIIKRLVTNVTSSFIWIEHWPRSAKVLYILNTPNSQVNGFQKRNCLSFETKWDNIWTWYGIIPLCFWKLHLQYSFKELSIVYGKTLELKSISEIGLWFGKKAENWCALLWVILNSFKVYELQNYYLILFVCFCCESWVDSLEYNKSWGFPYLQEC